MPRIFIAQALVDAWISATRAQLDADLLRIPVTGDDERIDFFINPAVFFDRVDGSEADAFDVVGKVKTSQELAAMDAEHYDTSVVLGDAAYTVVPGVVATAVDARGSELPLDGPAWQRIAGVLEALPQG